MAWNLAVEKAAGRKITARIVQAAMREVVPPDPSKPKPAEARRSRAEHRKLIDTAFGEILVLLSQKASHSILMQKIEALHGQIQALFPNPQR